MISSAAGRRRPQCRTNNISILIIGPENYTVSDVLLHAGTNFTIVFNSNEFQYISVLKQIFTWS